MTTVHLVGGVEKRALVLEAYDPQWPGAYAEQERGIRAALGPTAVQVEHVGSTSVPGLAAKPIIDVLVTVDDVTAEEDYLPQLLEVGYELRVREPGHRMVRTPARDVHVHLVQVDDAAADAYLLFRDRLRADPEDRTLYERTKRALIEQDWADMNAYAEAKSGIINEIMARARGSRTSGRHPSRIDDADGSAISRLLEESRRGLARVQPAELASLGAAGALVVDIRPVEQRDRDGALPGAVVVDRNVLEWRLDPTSPWRLAIADDADRVVVLVCDEGYSSSLAARTLQQLGLPNATDLCGGFRAWAREVRDPAAGECARVGHVEGMAHQPSSPCT